ncbi:kynureninase [Helicovermis profundi]|uniref:Kynureninase n=1 Tax=Helicovermis profundi TaxID=3065157 RepID=A0AAU9E0H2_9FIRM|nr:kynureninase [Clostridia bacterium S502]
MFDATKEYALKLDLEDESKKFRDRFYIQNDLIYMDGNSLGMMSIDAETCVNRVLNEWKTLAINGWSDAKIPWFYYAEELAKKMSKFMGTSENEIIIHSSATINLHIGLSIFYKPEGIRSKIIMDELNFPSDIYAVKSHIKSLGYEVEEVLELIKSNDGKTINEDDIINSFTNEIALVILPSVLYRSGQLLNIERITKEAHKKGIYVLFDLCHSAGAFRHELSKWDVDFAFWCGYKYFNNGPGGVASIYINKKHFDRETGLAGWFGYKKESQFDMKLDFVKSKNAGGFQISTPHLLSMAPLEGSLNIFEEAGIDNLRSKSLKLTDYLIFLIEKKLSKFDFTIGTPKEHSRRGGHVALEHDDAIRINEAIKNNNIIPDFRFPNTIRLAPIALYTSFFEVWKVVDIIEKIMMNEEYKKFDDKRSTIA